MPTHYSRAFAANRRLGRSVATAAFACLALLAASPALTAQTPDTIIVSYIGALQELHDRLRDMSDADRAQRNANELPPLIDKLNPLVFQMKALYGNPASQQALQSNADRLNIAQTRLQQQQSRLLTGDCGLAASAQSLNSNTPLRVTFVNTTREAATLYWVKGPNDHWVGPTIQPGQNHVQDTFVTHPWVAKTAAGVCMNFFQPTSATTYPITGSLAPTLGPFLANIVK